MHNLVLRAWLELRQNYWFWPSVLTALAVALGFLMPVLDARLADRWIEGLTWLRAMQVDGARDMLTTLAGAVLGVAGVSFSITIVAVSFASGNYGPRLIGNFMRDRTNQVVLGLFLATFTYCVTVMRAVHAATGEGGPDSVAAFVPQLSIVVAMVLALTSVGALIYFIHHVPESINIMNIVARIGGDLDEAVRQALEADEETPLALEHGWIEPDDDTTAIGAPVSGYIQQIDYETLEEGAERHDARMRVLRRAGEFVVKGEDVMLVRPGEALDEEALDEATQCIAIGSERTGAQDLFFMADEMIEVIGRALSPGINDPHTAVTCLDWLRVGLSRLAAKCPADEEDLWRGHRVARERASFASMLRRVFGGVRQYVSADRNVVLHALLVLEEIARAAGTPERLALVMAEAEALVSSARGQLAEESARREVDERFAAMRRALSLSAPRAAA